MITPEQVADPEVEQNYQENWKEILEPNGVLVMEQLKKELFDFSRMMENMTTIVHEITGGRMSYPTYPATTVLRIASEYREKEWEEYLKDHDEEQRELIAQQAATIDKMRGLLRKCYRVMDNLNWHTAGYLEAEIEQALNQSKD